MCLLLKESVLPAVACTVCAVSLAALGSTRSISGLESVLSPGDATNGGFWDVTERPATTVGDGEASLGAAIETSGRSADEFWTMALDARAFTWGESGLTAVRTDPFIGLHLILR